MNTITHYCTCENVYQDEKYGKGKRVMNPTSKLTPPTYRCTVCGREWIKT
jgi:hypothetical protein